jgi:manganese transport protein
LRAVAAVLGPAFVAAVAYVDPGNFAVNIGAGAAFGYRLAWVVLLASLLAMPVQFLAAKIGIVTGQSLPQICRARCGSAVRWGLWLQAELIAMATDLAEVVGAAIGLNLLFGIPLLAAGLVAAVISFGVLSLQLRGHRPFEIATVFLLLVVFAGFLYDLLRVGPDVRLAVAGLVPALPGQGAVLLAVSIVGATIMPHVVYLHSALTATRIRCRTDAERAQVLRYERWDVISALGLAGLVNLAMLLVAAKVFHVGGQLPGAVSIARAHAGLADLVGGGAALAFAVALLASGLSAASVGTFAGQAIMEGFLGRRGSVFIRRGITVVPALAVLACGLSPTRILVLSQVILSFGIPFALVPLVLITRSRHIMGAFAIGRWTASAMWLITATITGLNVVLLWQFVV